MPSKRVMWLGHPSFAREVLAIQIGELSHLNSLTMLCFTEIIHFCLFVLVFFFAEKLYETHSVL